MYFHLPLSLNENNIQTPQSRFWQLFGRVALCFKFLYFQKFKMEPSTTPVSSALHHPPPSAPASSSANPQHGCQQTHHTLDHLSPSPASNSSSAAAAADPSRNLASSPGKWAENLATSSGAPESSAVTPPSAAAPHHVSSRPGKINEMQYCPYDTIFSVKVPTRPYAKPSLIKPLQDLSIGSTSP